MSNALVSKQTVKYIKGNLYLLLEDDSFHVLKDGHRFYALTKFAFVQDETVLYVCLRNDPRPPILSEHKDVNNL